MSSTQCRSVTGPLLVIMVISRFIAVIYVTERTTARSMEKQPGPTTMAHPPSHPSTQPASPRALALHIGGVWRPGHVSAPPTPRPWRLPPRLSSATAWSDRTPLRVPTTRPSPRPKSGTPRPSRLKAASATDSAWLTLLRTCPCPSTVTDRLITAVGFDHSNHAPGAIVSHGKGGTIQVVKTVRSKYMDHQLLTNHGQGDNFCGKPMWWRKRRIPVRRHCRIYAMHFLAVRRARRTRALRPELDVHACAHARRPTWAGPGISHTRSFET